VSLSAPANCRDIEGSMELILLSSFASSSSSSEGCSSWSLNFNEPISPSLIGAAIIDSLNASRHCDSFLHRVEPVIREFSLIPNKYHFLSFRIKFHSQLFWHMHIGVSTKNTKMFHTGFSTCPKFKWRCFKILSTGNPV